MKATRWLAVAALLSCAAARLQSQPSRQLLLVHGIWSSGDTWNPLRTMSYFTGDDTIWTLYTPNLLPNGYFSENRDSLVAYMNNLSLANDVGVVAHSMGGIISRLASREHQTQGLITIGSPHHGAPIANALTAPWWDNELAPI